MALPNDPPIINREAAEKAKAASAIHLASQMKATSGQPNLDAINKLGAAFTSDVGQTDVRAAQAQAQQDVASVGREFQQGQFEQQSQNLAAEENAQRTILAQQQKLADLGLELDQTEFDTNQSMQMMKANNSFTNEMQVADLARARFQSDEEYADMLQEAQQRMQEKAAEDAWELSVYEKALSDATMREQLAKDAKLMEEIQLAKAEAERKAKESRKKAAKTGKMIGAATVVAGAAITVASGGSAAPVGASMMASGASQYAASEQQSAQ